VPLVKCEAEFYRRIPTPDYIESVSFWATRRRRLHWDVIVCGSSDDQIEVQMTDEGKQAFVAWLDSHAVNVPRQAILED
jgi:hypothetical protein